MSVNGWDLLGMFIAGVVAGALILISVTPDRGFHREAVLPRKCYQGQQVLVTTPTPVEYYVCESHWVRR